MRHQREAAGERALAILAVLVDDAGERRAARSPARADRFAALQHIAARR
jgi:hypothetical protein